MGKVRRLARISHDAIFASGNFGQRSNLASLGSRLRARSFRAGHRRDWGRRVRSIWLVIGPFNVVAGRFGAHGEPVRVAF